MPTSKKWNTTGKIGVREPASKPTLHSQIIIYSHQGSILSSSFCNIYFGYIEEFLLNGIFQGSSLHRLVKGNTSANCDSLFCEFRGEIHLLVRITDDFLFISTDKQTSSCFLKKVSKGVPSLGVNINPCKTQVNYSIAVENTEMVSTTTDVLFQWCGLLIDTATCEICLANPGKQQAINTVVAHRAAGNGGINLKKKMKDFVRPRCCQKLLFSGTINGIQMIRVNFYRTLLLCAIKTLHYIRQCVGMDTMKNQKFIYGCAIDCIKYAFSLVSSKAKPNNAKIGMTSNDAMWLGRHAFCSAFKRLGPQYAELCSLLSECSRLKNRGDLMAISRIGGFAS